MENKDYIVDVFLSHPERWMRKYDFIVVCNKDHFFYTIHTDKKTALEISRKATFRHINVTMYKQNYARSSDYRKVFLQNTTPPYRCRYCNRKLKTEYLEVDHLIPVGKVKSNPTARRRLRRLGADNVNDIKNLVPSCHRCNKRKGSDMGIWYIKGLLGKYEWYWKIRPVLWLAIIGLVAFALYRSVKFIYVG